MRNPVERFSGGAQVWWRRLKAKLGFSPKTDSGSAGERAAELFLKHERRFTIVARNWRNPRDRREEIDLVARDGETLVFVEVKTRAAHALVSGFHAVTSGKKKILRRAIKAYLARLTEKPRTFRFDVVEVVQLAAGPTAGGSPEDALEVRHYENVTLFPKHFHT